MFGRFLFILCTYNLLYISELQKVPLFCSYSLEIVLFLDNRRIYRFLQVHHFIALNRHKKNPSTQSIRADGFCVRSTQDLELWSYLVDTIDKVTINVVSIAEGHSKVTVTDYLNDIQIVSTGTQEVVNTTVSERV